jgi:ATP/ADP translocase
MPKSLARLFPILPGEYVSVGVLFAHYFLVSAAVIAGKAARDAFFLTRYDKSLLPLMYLANAVCIALVMSGFSRFGKRLSPGTGAAVTAGFFSVTLVLIELRLDGWMVAVLYVWMEVIGTVVIVQSWLLTGNAFDPRQAKRLFGVIAAGGSIAAWVGGVSIAWMAANFGSSSLITAVAIALAASTVTAWYGGRFQALRPRSHARRSTADGKRRKLSPYVTSIAILIAAAAMVSAVIQYRFQVAAAAAYPSRDQLVGFFGHFYAWTGAASLASQLFLSNFILSRFGVIAGLFVLPTCFAAGSALTLVSSSLWSAGFGRFSDLTFKFTVNNSSLEMLWLVVPPEERLSVKPVVSGTLKAVSEAGTAALMFLLIRFSPAWVLSVFALLLCGAWLTVVVRLRGQYRQALLNVIEKRQLNAESLRLTGTDPLVTQSINRSLQTADESEQLAALSFLDGLPLLPWSAALHDLLATGSTEIRDRVLVLAANDRTVLTDATVVTLLHSGGTLASTAIRIAGERELPSLETVFGELASSPDPATSIAAASALLRHRRGDADSARAVLSSWLDSDDPAAIARVIGSAAYDSSVLPPSRLRALIRHSDPGVRCAATEAIGARQDISLLPDVVVAFADAHCARAARVAIREMPAEVVVLCLVKTITNSENRYVRRGAIRMLREYPEAVREEDVCANVTANDLDAYSEVADLLRAVRSLRQIQPNVSSHLRQDCLTIRTTAYLFDAARRRLKPDPDALLFCDLLNRQYTSAVGATLRLVAVEHPAFPVDACLQAINSGDPAMVPYVLELMETTIDGQQRRFLAPLIEESQRNVRESIFLELFENPESDIRAHITNAVSSSDPWEAAVAAHYLVKKGELVTAAAAGGITQSRTELDMYSKLEKTILLKSSDLFGALSAESLATLSGIATEVRLGAGEVLFHDGEPGDSLYLVTSGRVRILKGGSEIAVLTKGASFGEMAVLDQAPRSADAVILDEAVLLRIESEEFYEVLAETPALSQGLIRLLTRRLRDANARIAQTHC